MAEVKVFRGVGIIVNSDGIFRAQVAGEWLYAETLKEVESKVEKILKKTKVSVSIPVSQLGVVWSDAPYRQGRWSNGIGVRHLTVTGIHGGTGNVIVKDEKTGKTEQLTGWRAGVVRRLTDVEVAEYVRLAAEERAAVRALRTYVGQFELKGDLPDQIKEAQGEKIDTPVESEELVSDDPRL